MYWGLQIFRICNPRPRPRNITFFEVKHVPPLISTKIIRTMKITRMISKNQDCMGIFHLTRTVRHTGRAWFLICKVSTGEARTTE